MSEVRLLISTAPPDLAEGLARQLVEERLAACVNLLPGVRSLYRWQGAVQDDPETVLLIKTTATNIDLLQARWVELHPHETPELLVFRPEGGLPAYLAWVEASTTAAADQQSTDTDSGPTGP